MENEYEFSEQIAGIILLVEKLEKRIDVLIESVIDDDIRTEARIYGYAKDIFEYDMYMKGE